MTVHKPERTEMQHARGTTRPARRSSALLAIGDLAERLGTSERFVRRLIAERRVPFHKVGKYVRFDPRDIDQWLDERRVDAME